MRLTQFGIQIFTVIVAFLVENARREMRVFCRFGIEKIAVSAEHVHPRVKIGAHRVVTLSTSHVRRQSGQRKRTASAETVDFRPVEPSLLVPVAHSPDLIPVLPDSRFETVVIL